MPVSPKQVAAFVESCDLVDEAIEIIDGYLGTPNEKMFRKGDADGAVEHDYYYTILLPFKLDLTQVEDLRIVYQRAGWPAVQIGTINQSTTQVRLFMNKNSKYFGAE